jgi:tripartite-type tricarboxylate transporter receptor subunit TctC
MNWRAVVVENRGAAGDSIEVNIIARADQDGHTILSATPDQFPAYLAQTIADMKVAAEAADLKPQELARL